MAAPSHRIFWRRYWPAGLTLSAGLAVTAVVAWILYRDAVAFDRRQFRIEATAVSEALETTMEHYEERLSRLADYCARFKEMPADIWNFRSKVMTVLPYDLPAVIHAAYCPKIPASDFDLHAARGKKAFGHYSFDSQSRPGRKLALPVWQFYSRRGFVPMSRGTDMAVGNSWWPSLIPALAHVAGWVSPAPERVPRGDKTFENGFWFVLALYEPDQIPAYPRHKSGETIRQRADRHRQFYASAATGLLAAFISTDELVDAAYNDPKTFPRLNVRLYSAEHADRRSLLNPALPAPERPRHRVLIMKPWYERHWTLEITSTPEFETGSPRFRAWLFGGAGVGMTFLATALVGMALRTAGRRERMTAQIREARDALAAAQQERERVSHDLHDNAVQALYAIQLGLGHTAQGLDGDPVQSRRQLALLRADLDGTIAEIRRFIQAETPGQDSAELAGVLRTLANRSKANHGIHVATECQPEASKRLTGAQAVQLANIAREALSNSLRHANARNVFIALRSGPDTVTLELSDDGIGFDPSAPKHDGLGLATMTTRARNIGATLELRSAPGEGTHIVVRVSAAPLEHPGDEGEETDAD